MLQWTTPDGTAHETCRLLFFLGADFLGEAPFDPGNAPEMGYRRGGAIFVCADCGEIWGRVVLVNSAGRTLWFEDVYKIPCERHSSQWETSGSFLGGYRGEGFLKYMPLEAARREFHIHLRQMEADV